MFGGGDTIQLTTPLWTCSWGCSSVVNSAFGMHKTLSSIPAPKTEKQKKECSFPYSAQLPTKPYSFLLFVWSIKALMTVFLNSMGLESYTSDTCRWTSMLENHSIMECQSWEEPQRGTLVTLLPYCRGTSLRNVPSRFIPK